MSSVGGTKERSQMTLQERALKVMDEATDLVDIIDSEEWADALTQFGNLADAAAELAPELAQKAFDGGMTKKAIAEKLNISPRDLVGMVKTS